MRSKSYPDPQQFTSTKEFTYAAQVASIYKKVVGEILKYLEDEVPEKIKTFKAKEKGEDPNFGIGRG